MSVRVVRLGTPRARGEGLRIGTVRRPPRGVPKSEFASENWYDVWFPNLAPSLETMKRGLSAETPAQWLAFVKRYRSEMAAPMAKHDIALLSALSRVTNFSVGCYCEQESHCHRSILKTAAPPERRCGGGVMAADTPWVRTLLDETDTRLRARQHFSILGAIALLLAAVPMVGDPGLLRYGILTIAVALVLFGYAATVDQRWDTEYKGHKVRYQNNPLRGEKLIVDGRRVARGKLGIRAEMRAPLEGSDEVIVAQSDARLTRLRCHIFVESSVARPPASAISDQELLAEVQRRGLRT